LSKTQTAEEIQRVEAFIERAPWTFASTMPETPHEYTKRGQMPDAEFDWFIGHIREYGVRMRSPVSSHYYIYLVAGGHKYWTLGWPVEQTTILNRAKVEPEDPMVAQQRFERLV
jgi:hypothetical protein